MRSLLSALLLLTLAVPLAAQSPSADWQTIETPHFRIHFPREYSEWATRAASRIESIRDAVVREVGFEPPQKIDVIITNPIAQANGMALPLLDTPRLVFYAEPPGPDEQIGSYASWIDLLAVHEITHIVHMLRPSRNPLERLLEASVLPLNPITLRAPRWVHEGYATVVEGRLTGSGRPSGTMRALVLRRWAEGGRLPTYAQLSSDRRFLGMSMAYLAGSAFLEWLEQRNGSDSLRALWARMTARHRRSFDEAFTGVFGDSPERLYGRFAAELTASAMTIDRATTLQEGESFQKTPYATGDPAASPDGSRLAIVIRERDAPAKLVVWSTGEPVEEEKKFREQLDRILARDPQDVAPVRAFPLDRKTLQSLTMPDGGDILAPRWARDGASILFTHRMPDREGFLHFDLFRWFPSSGQVERITHLADVDEADFLPSGNAIAVRSRNGATQLVRIDVKSGAVTELTRPRIDEVYSTPRVSPGGESVAFVLHRAGRWRLATVNALGGEVVEIPSSEGDFSSPSWITNDLLLASVASRGFVEAVTMREDGTLFRLTRTAGGAFSPTLGAGRVYFMTLDPDGFVVWRIPFDVPGQAPAPPQFDRVLVPAMPPAAPQPTLFAAADAPAHRPYGLGRQEPGWLVGQNVGPEQNAIEAGVRVGDVIGRLDTLLVGSFSNDAAESGGALATAWRGWPVELGAHVFTAKRRLDETTVERSGAELRASWSARNALGRFSAEAGGFTGKPADFGFGELVVGRRQGSGTARLDATMAAWADGGAGTHLRGVAELRARVGSMMLRGTYRHDQLSRDTHGASGERRELSVGGLPSSIVPKSLYARQVLDPALPVGTLHGDRYDGWRVEMSLAGPVTAFYQRHDMGEEGLALAGAELAMSVPPTPLVKTPALHVTAGGAKIFDGPLKGETKYWIALTWRP